MRYRFRSECYSFLTVSNLFLLYVVAHQVSTWLWFPMLLIQLSLLVLVSSEYSVRKDDEQIQRQELEIFVGLSEEELVEQDYIAAKRRGGA